MDPNVAAATRLSIGQRQTDHPAGAVSRPGRKNVWEPEESNPEVDPGVAAATRLSIGQRQTDHTGCPAGAVSRPGRKNVWSPQSGIQATEHFDANVLTPQSKLQGNFFVPTFASSLTSSCATLMQCEAVETHFDSMRLQSGTILTVEQVEDEFECPECWKHPINNATCFKHCIEFAYSIFSFCPAAGQTGDVASAGSGVTGALAVPSDEAPAETPRGKFQKTKSQCNGCENSKALQTERSRICSGALYVGGIDDENDINTDSEAMVQQ